MEAAVEWDGTDNNLDAFLAPTYYIDSDNPAIVAFSEKATKGLTDPTEKAIALFDAVRDGYRYDPYSMSHDTESYRASVVVGTDRGWCVTKSILLTAAARAAGIPAAIGFADVKNHLNTPKLREVMGGSDLFAYHGFAVLYLKGRWIKVSPAFNMQMCTRFHTKPLIFDGEHDALLHEFDQKDRKHMEYLRERGIFLEAPVQDILDEFDRIYPNFSGKVADAQATDKAFHAAE